MSYIDEFHLEVMGHEYEAGACVVLDSSMMYFVSGSDKGLKYLTVNTDDLQKKDINGLKTQSNWTKTVLHNMICEENRNGAKLTSKFRPAAVQLNGMVYLFWVDEKDNNVYMTFINPSAPADSVDSRAWVYQIKANDSSGSTPATQLAVSSWLSANIMPDGKTIALNYFSKVSKDDYRLVTLALDPGGIVSKSDDHSWTGITQTGAEDVNPAYYLKLDLPGLDLDDDYYRVSTVWFTAGGIGNFMVASFYSDKAHLTQFLVYKIHEDGTLDWENGSAPRKFDKSQKSRRGFSLCRDPAGRIFGIYCETDDAHLYWKILPTWMEDTGLKDPKDDNPVPVLAWETDAYDLNGEGHDSRKCPVAAFVPGCVEKADSSTDPDKSVFEFPWYLLVLYAVDGEKDGSYELHCQVADYGRSQIIENNYTHSPNPDPAPTPEPNVDARAGILSLVMDTFPYPNENLPQPPMLNSPVIVYTYGTTKSSEVSTKASFDLQFGIRSKFETTKGAGPAAETEYKTGPSGGYVNAEQMTSFRGYSAPTTAVTDNPARVSSRAPYFYSSYPQLGQDDSLFLEDKSFFPNAKNEPVNGVSAPCFGSLHPIKNTYTNCTYDFNTFCYTPGMIHTYAPEAINQTMREKFEGLSEGDKQYLIGEDGSGNGYDSYLSKIIKNKLQKFGEKDYLEFSFSQNGMIGEEFSESSSRMTMLGWNASASYYLGVSGGEEFSVFGFGVGASFSFMAGVEFKFSLGVEKESSAAWGVKIDTAHMPFGVQNAKSYTVRMYFCQPHNLWARELKVFGNVSGFASSSPAKIFFVVSQIDKEVFDVDGAFNRS